MILLLSVIFLVAALIVMFVIYRAKSLKKYRQFFNGYWESVDNQSYQLHMVSHVDNAGLITGTISCKNLVDMTEVEGVTIQGKLGFRKATIDCYGLKRNQTTRLFGAHLYFKKDKLRWEWIYSSYDYFPKQILLCKELQDKKRNDETFLNAKVISQPLAERQQL